MVSISTELLYMYESNHTDDMIHVFRIEIVADDHVLCSVRLSSL